MEKQKQSWACSPQCSQFATPPLCPLLIKWPSIINAAVTRCFAAQQVWPKSTRKHSLENVHLPPPSDLIALMSLEASHVISLISSRTFWCSLRSPRGDRVRCGLPPSKSSRHLRLILLHVTQGRSRRGFVREGGRKAQRGFTVKEDALRKTAKERKLFRASVWGLGWLLFAGVVEQGD